MSALSAKELGARAPKSRGMLLYFDMGATILGCEPAPRPHLAQRNVLGKE